MIKRLWGPPAPVAGGSGSTSHWPVLLLQEFKSSPLYGADLLVHTTGYQLEESCVPGGAADPGRGAAVAVPKGLLCQRRRDLEPAAHAPGLSVVVCAVGRPGDPSSSQLLVASVYRSPGSPHGPLCAWLRRVWAAAPGAGCGGLIVGGDLNAWHEECGCYETSPSGTALILAVSDVGGVVLNDGRHTRHPQGLNAGRHRSSAIDVTIVPSAEAALFGESWDLLDMLAPLSDHDVVTFERPWPGPRPWSRGRRGASRAPGANTAQQLASSMGLVAAKGRWDTVDPDRRRRFRQGVERSLRALHALPTPEAEAFDWAVAAGPTGRSLWSVDPDRLARDITNTLVRNANRYLAVRSRGRARQPFWTDACQQALDELGVAKRAVAAHARRVHAAGGLGALSAEGRAAALVERTALRRARGKKGRRMGLVTRRARRAFFTGFADGLSRYTPSGEVWRVVQMVDGRKGTLPTGGVAAMVARRGLVVGPDDTTTVDAQVAADTLADFYASVSTPTPTAILVERAARTDGRGPLGLPRSSPSGPPPPPGPNARRVRVGIDRLQQWARDAGHELRRLAPGDATRLPVEGDGRRVTVAELRSGRRAGKNPAPGFDRVPSALLRHGGDELDRVLATLASLQLALGHWPDVYKLARVTPLLKPSARGDVDGLVPSHTRPISVLTALASDAEAVLTNRLAAKLERSGKLSKAQFGFRVLRNSVDPLVHKMQTIKQAWSRGWFVVAFKLDAKKAYDKVTSRGLLHKLRTRAEVRGPLLRLVADYLAGRRATVAVGRTLSKVVDLLCGVPQGGRPSPILFAVDIDDAPGVFLDAVDGHAGGFLYADDEEVWIELPGPAAGVANWRWHCSALLHRFQREVIDEVVCIAAITGRDFRVDTGKVGCVAFIPNAQDQGWGDPAAIVGPLPCLYLRDEPIIISLGEMVSLGVKFDSHATFVPHVDLLVARATKRLVVLKCLAGRAWGASRSVLLTLWRSWIKSTLMYASDVWGVAAPAQLRRLDAIQRSALCYALGVSHGTARLAVVDEAGDPPLQVSRLRSAALSAERIRRLPSSRILRAQWQAWEADAARCQHDTKTAERACMWLDVQIDRRPFTDFQLRRDGHERWRCCPFAFMHAAAAAVGMERRRVGIVESLLAERVRAPWLADPLDGVVPAAPVRPAQDLSLERLQDATVATAQIFPPRMDRARGTWPIFGPASSRTAVDKARAQAYTVALVDRLEAVAGAVVCYTDGASVMAYGKNVVRPVPGGWPPELCTLEGQARWTGEGSGAGCAVWCGQQWVAEWGVPLGALCDSFASELWALADITVSVTHQLLPGFVRPPHSTRRSDELQWVWPGADGAAAVAVATGVVFVVSDNQWGVVAAATGAQELQPCAPARRLPDGYIALEHIASARAVLASVGIRLVFLWAPGHADGVGNDKADERAGVAAQIAAWDGTGRSLFPTPIRVSKNFIRRRYVQLWRTKRLAAREHRYAGHKHLCASVLWQGATMNWLYDADLSVVTHQWRWHTTPRALVFRRSRTEEVVVARMRLLVAPTNYLLWHHYGDPDVPELKDVQCRYCGAAVRADDPFRGVEHALVYCVAWEDQRQAQAGALRSTLSLDAVDGEDEAVRKYKAPFQDDTTLIKGFFTWQLLLLHSHLLGGPYVERTQWHALDPGVCAALAKVLFRFLRSTTLLRDWSRSHRWALDARQDLRRVLEDDADDEHDSDEDAGSESEG